ncbi:MAG: AraC family transcriptional regulator [Capsulimonadales bacterium]|nr:AraC family transcriptional regulator [Capsulimonadales bacterium]
MKEKRADSGSVAADSVQPETIRARSEGWPDVRLLIRSRGPGVICLPHGHREHLLFCKSGTPDGDRPVRSVVRTGGQVRQWDELPDRSVTFLPAGYPFEWEWTYISHSIHLILPVDVMARATSEIVGGAACAGELTPLFCVADPVMASLLGRLGEELRGNGYGTCMAVAAVTQLLIVHLLRAGGERPVRPEAEPSGLSPKQQRCVLAILGDHPTENLRLQELAEAVGLSQFHFARRFKQSFGVPPHEYQIRQRIEKARTLLREVDEEPIANIAALLGFNDESHFRRHFKRVVGVTPCQYRRHP